MYAIDSSMAAAAALMVERGAKLAKGCTNGRMVRICFALERFNTPLHVFVGTFLCASMRRRARSATAAGNGGSDGASPSPAAGSVLQKLNSHGLHHATNFKRAIAEYAGVPLLGALPSEYVEFLAEARRRGRA